MEIKNLVGINTTEILEVFNHSFSDYFISFKLTLEQLKSKMKADKTDLSLSVGAFENDKLVAFILHGFDIINNEKLVYNGGTGVIPEKRGTGLTKQMYSFILPLLKEEGINKLVLEVISKNIQAIKSYQKSGFETKRELICYKGKIKTSDINPSIEIKNIEFYDWSLLKSFWDVSPTWQNACNTLDITKDSTISLGAFLQNKLVGYIIFNPTSKRIQQIAVDSDFRRKKIATTLITEVICGDTNILAINVDKSSQSLNPFFKSIGLKNDLEQLEMESILT